MILELIAQDPNNFDCWITKDEEGKERIVDLCVDDPTIKPLLSKGVSVEIDYLYSYVSIASGVKVLP